MTQVTPPFVCGTWLAARAAVTRPRRTPPQRRITDSDPAVDQLHVLAVDDDAAYRRFIAHVLESAGFRVSLAATGEEALEMLRSDPTISLLLIDLSMPGIDGIETVRRIRDERERSGIYAILVTAHERPDIRLRALQNGLDDFLPKSASVEEVIARVRSAARRVGMERTLQLRNAELEALALTDELTSVANRRGLVQAAAALVREEAKFSAILIDLDHFKKVNDTYGHAAGDTILSGVAATLRAHTRSSDIIARFGGDEFVLLLPSTGVRGGGTLARRIVDAIAAMRWNFDGQEVSVTVQFGVASSAHGSNIENLVTECDRALFRRKKALKRSAAAKARVRALPGAI